MQAAKQLYELSHSKWVLMIDRIKNNILSLWELEFSIDESYRL